MDEIEEKKNQDEQKLQKDGAAEPSNGTNEAPDDAMNPAGEKIPDSDAGTQPVTDEVASAEQQNQPEGTAQQVSQPAEQMIPQSKVDAIVRERISETYNKAYAEGRTAAINELNEKYGVGSSDELDGLFSNGQKYGIMNEQFDGMSKENSDLKAQIALLESGIDKNKFEDVKAILAYNHQDVNPQTIELALQTHPEWKTQNDVSSPAMGMVGTAPASKPIRFQKVGGEPTAPSETDGKAKAFELMNLK